MNRTFGKKKIIKDISANTLQTGITQVFGLLIFYLTSKYLVKDEFGELNWSMAVGSTIIAVASLGLDLVYVRKIAAGENALVISGIHLFHTVLSAMFLGGAVFAITIFVPSFDVLHPYFPFVFIYLALANIANSFKLGLNGLEAYKQLAIIALVANVFKLSFIFYLYLSGSFKIFNVVMAYTLTSVVEFVLGYLMINRNLTTRVKPILKIQEYKYFILESLPQLGVVLFDSALARLDWILLGIITTSAITAEYSFVYKVFELSKLPLLIVAPVLLTRFSKIFGAEKEVSVKHKIEIELYLKLELFIMMLIPIVLISTWSPLVDYFTDGKYGLVNEQNYWVLAACVPMAGIINFLWTLGFVQGQLKQIMFITIAASVINIMANALLIPLYGAFGSALAFLVSTLIQVMLYYKFIDRKHVTLNLKSCAISFTLAFISVVVGKLVSNNLIFTTGTSLILFCGLTLLSRQIKLGEVQQLLRSNIDTKVNQHS